jgi:TubC N-terminal docking domain
MMGTDALISELIKRGAQLAEKDGKLWIEAPRGTLTPELLTALRQNKVDLLTRLTHAKNSVQARIRGLNRTVEISSTLAEICWHCRGQKACDCSSCHSGLDLKLRSGPCRACLGTGWLSWPQKVQ